MSRVNVPIQSNAYLKVDYDELDDPQGLNQSC